MHNFGPVMLDVEANQLSQEDKSLLANRLVGGLILFARNFESAEQVFQLTREIKQINPNILIAVDQEGGRVQRFTEGFSKIPAMKKIGSLYQKEQGLALAYCEDLAELMALEVRAVGCDISFAPVLDLGYESSKVIGDRAFSTEVNEIIELGRAFINGMNKAGMGATGKHFPGHGSVEADSHVSIPYDDRELIDIKNNDIRAFSQLSSNLNAIMPAHIVYRKVDHHPAGFSIIWLQQILREELRFNGVIFSDDLSMKGAEVAGNFSQRAKLALNAGCDMILVCNDRQAVNQVLDELENFELTKESQLRLAKLKMKEPAIGLAELKMTKRWQYLNTKLSEFNQLVGG